MEEEKFTQVEVVWQRARSAFANWNKHHATARHCRREIEHAKWMDRRIRHLAKREPKELERAAYFRRAWLNKIPLCMLHIDIRLEEATGLCADVRSLLFGYLDLHRSARFERQNPAYHTPPTLVIEVPCWCTWTLPGRTSGDPDVSFFSKSQAIVYCGTDKLPLLPHLLGSENSEFNQLYRHINAMRPYLCDTSKPKELYETKMKLLESVGFSKCVQYPFNAAEFQPLLDQLAKDTQTMRVT